MSASYERVGGTEVLGWLLLGSSLTLVIIIIIFIIITITRPKPDYGRQGLAGSWGQDTDEVSTFLVFSLRACGAQLQNNPTRDH